MTESELTRKLGNYSTPTLFEVSSQGRALGSEIAPLYRPINLWGHAYPVLVRTGDNLAIHYAVAKASAGSVLVVATGRDRERGYWGEILTEAALARGIRGLVIDGGVRDTKAIRERSFPIFCAAIAIPGTSKDQDGVLNQPVKIGQVLIRPNDFIVGDDDGVVVVYSEEAGQVLEAAEGRTQKESEIVERVRKGELTVKLFNFNK